MQKSIVLLVFLFLFLAACQSEFPQEPGAPGTTEAKAGISTVGRAYYRSYEGYAPPVDVFDNNKQIFFLDNYIFNLDPEEEYLSINPKVSQEGGYIYKYYYVYENRGWVKYEFPETTFKRSSWIKDAATDGIGIRTGGLGVGENYIVAYSCRKYRNEWKCGCSGEYDLCNQWMLNTFIYRNFELPPEPTAPGEVITMRAWINPASELVITGKEIGISVWLESKRSDIENAPDTAVVRIISGNGNVEMVELQKRADVSCNEGKEEDAMQFECHVGYYGAYIPLSDGEYTIDLGEELPSYVKLQTGSFKAVPLDYFKKYLILEDIDGFKNREYDFGGSYNEDWISLWTSYENSETWAYVYTDSPARWLPDKDYKKLAVNGDTVYVWEEVYSEEERIYWKVMWLSGDRTVKVSTRSKTLEEIMPIVKAYLAKYPSYNPNCGENEAFCDDFNDNNLEDWSITSPEGKEHRYASVSDGIISGIGQGYSDEYEPWATMFKKTGNIDVSNGFELELRAVSASSWPNAATVYLYSDDGNKYMLRLYGESSNYNIDWYIISNGTETPFRLNVGSGVLENWHIYKLGMNRNGGALYIDGKRLTRARIPPLKETTTSFKEIAVEVAREGSSVDYVRLTPSVSSPVACTDSDGGIEYYVKGSVSAPNVGATDTCGTGEWEVPVGTLVEHYCDNNNLASEYYKCHSGCQDGACLNQTAANQTI